MQKLGMGGVALSLVALVGGCGGSVGVPIVEPPPYVPPVGNYSGLAFTGKVMAGSAPVVGASVQIYAAGTTGNGSAPTQLLASTLTTDANGAFSVAAGYTCPLSTSVMYVVATGGRVGSNGANAAIELMNSPGDCNSVAANASYVVNEATTVASAYAFAAFLKAGAQMGASSTNGNGITLAAGTLANLMNVATGAVPGPGFPATGKAPTAKLSALANALNACAASTGLGSSACTQLFAAATVGTATPANTLDAALAVAQHPGGNVAAVYSASKGSSAYGAGLASPPADWTMYVTYGGGGMNYPTALAVDSTGRVWVASYFGAASLFTNAGAPVFASGIGGNGLANSYGLAVDASDDVWVTNETGSVTELTSAGVGVAGSPYSGSGIYFPVAIAFDATTGTAWIADNGNPNAGVVLLSGTGKALSGSSGYANGQFNFPAAVGVDSKHFGWVANQSSTTVTKVAADGSSFTSYTCCDGPAGVAIDAADNVWVASYYGNSVALISGGAVLSGSSGFAGGGLYHPQGIAVDGAGTVWTANYLQSTLIEMAGVGAATPGAVMSPAGGYGTDAGLVETYAVAIDAGGNVWVTNEGANTLTEFVGMAAPVKTPLLGAVRVP